MAQPVQCIELEYFSEFLNASTEGGTTPAQLISPFMASCLGGGPETDNSGVTT